MVYKRYRPFTTDVSFIIKVESINDDDTHDIISLVIGDKHRWDLLPRPMRTFVFPEEIEDLDPIEVMVIVANLEDG